LTYERMTPMIRHVIMSFIDKFYYGVRCSLYTKRKTKKTL